MALLLMQLPTCSVHTLIRCCIVAMQAKLLVIAQEQQLKEVAEIRGDMVKAEWGQQIRNYVFHPYKMVKDVRTGEETGNVQDVMDGELMPFMRAFLRHKEQSKQPGSP